MSAICIVLATYNGEKFLAPMLDSLQAQTRKADRIIIIDDASADSTLQILQKYESALPLTVYREPQNSGHLAAFSKGLERARDFLSDDDLIALADQDDIWLPQKLELLEKELNQKNAVLVFGDAEVIDDNGKVIADSWQSLAKIPKELSVYARMAGINNVTGCCSLFKAKLLKNAFPFPKIGFVHDAWLALLAEKQHSIYAVSFPVIQYRLHENNAVGTGVSYTFQKTLNLQLAKLEFLKTTAAISWNADEQFFLNQLFNYWQKRKHQYFLFSFIPFLLKYRIHLFPESKKRWQKILFSLLGQKAVHLFFRNK